MTPRLSAALVELAEALVVAVREEAAAHSASPDRLLSVDEAAAMLGIGRSRLYAELQAGRCRSVKIGRRRLIPVAAIVEFIAGGRAS
jgi:excisionase family DNA binding protein